MIEVRRARYGRDAARALRDLLREAQAADPLAPVTVVVPRGQVGLATRRLLASGDLTSGDRAGEVLGGNERAGIAGVSFVTIATLAGDLGAHRLAISGRRPLHRPVLYGTVRSVLAASHGSLLGPVGDHTSTVRSVVSAYSDLEGVSAAGLEVLAARSAVSAELVGVIGNVRTRLGATYDDADVATFAIESIIEEPDEAVRRLGTVVVYLPDRPRGFQLRLLHTIADTVPTWAILGITGDGHIDESVLTLKEMLEGRDPIDHGGSDWNEQITVAVKSVIGPGGEDPLRTTVINAPTADAEILSVLRESMARAESGVRLDRMAIVHPGMPPYPRAIHDALIQAGIPFHGATHRKLATTLPGRLLLGFIGFGDHDFSRREVASWFRAGPVLDHGDPIPASRWDTVSRKAGIVSGRKSWNDRLTAFAYNLRQEATEHRAVDGESGMSRRLEDEASLADDLIGFFNDIAMRFDDPPSSWAAWCQWTRTVLSDFLTTDTAGSPWPREEVEALTIIEEALVQIEWLDAVDPTPSLSAFRAVLTAQLEVSAPGTTRFGQGVFVGRIADAVGLDFAVVFVLGMNDAQCPPRGSEDILLPDEDRRAVGEIIPLRDTQAIDAKKSFLAVSMTANERILSFARGDARRRAAARASRWLLEPLTLLTRSPSPLLAGDLETRPSQEGYQFLQSFTATVRGTRSPMSIGDFDVRELLHWKDRGNPVSTHPIATDRPLLRRGFQASAARRSRNFGPFVGQAVSTPESNLHDRPDRALSPTSLEDYAACPRRYFFKRVLRLDHVPDPEELYSLSRLDRGTLVHKILERYIGAEIHPEDEPREKSMEAEGLEGRLGRMEILAAAAFSECEAAGLTGRHPFWLVEQSSILRDLRSFVRKDFAHRQETGTQPFAVERAFGTPDAKCEVQLPSGERVAFRGTIDRVDRSEDGSLVVTDYKTGKHHKGEKGSLSGVGTGQSLQLPIYGIGVGAGQSATPVRAEYWYVSAEEDFLREGIDLDEEFLAQFSKIIATIVDGVNRAVFPARPGEEEYDGFAGCKHCEFTSACSPQRRRDWERLRQDPDLERLVSLVEPSTEREDAAPAFTESDGND